MKILKKTLTGFLLLGILMGFIFLTSLWDGKGQYFFDALVVLVIAYGTYEMITCARAKGYNVEIIPLCIMVAAAYPMTKFLGYLGFFLLIGCGIVLIFCFFVFDQKVKLKDMLMSVLIMFYPLLPVALVMQMLNAYGMVPFMLACGAAMFSDTIAYYAGSLIKGPKIFPQISPNKTYSGSLVGLLGGVAGAMIVYAMFEYAKLPVNSPLMFSEVLAHPILFYCLMGFAIAIVSEIGDLFASRIKRELEIKDFSHALGSHGGLLDRLDSIIFAVLLMAIVIEFLPL